VGRGITALITNRGSDEEVMVVMADIDRYVCFLLLKTKGPIGKRSVGQVIIPRREWEGNTAERRALAFPV
jgi:hypothetical protein